MSLTNNQADPAAIPPTNTICTASSNFLYVEHWSPSEIWALINPNQNKVKAITMIEAINPTSTVFTKKYGTNGTNPPRK
ncbi:hypothetical protein WICPIJ_000078 [Wickerhamomyces pijperi]|uniref:Uncharacterized protein n=1 Tax=Wickerhamomyces pijperi TaxID=599730 RepID=A0A9P8TR63_WICPI|nr:hypothetical protein WICPIJ_000078 [Wickerhamomyces pijperi]